MPDGVGLGEGETFLASDVVAFLEHTREAKLVGDRELVVITPEGAQLLDLDGEPIERAAETVTWDSAAAEKGGYETFMLKEIHEQPDALRETIGERLEGGEVVLDTGLTTSSCSASIASRSPPAAPRAMPAWSAAS